MFASTACSTATTTTFRYSLHSRMASDSEQMLVGYKCYATGNVVRLYNASICDWESALQIVQKKYPQAHLGQHHSGHPGAQQWHIQANGFNLHRSYAQNDRHRPLIDLVIQGQGKKGKHWELEGLKDVIVELKDAIVKPIHGEHLRAADTSLKRKQRNSLTEARA